MGSSLDANSKEIPILHLQCDWPDGLYTVSMDPSPGQGAEETRNEPGDHRKDHVNPS
jgi:hypothetical protein